MSSTRNELETDWIAILNGASLVSMPRLKSLKGHSTPSPLGYESEVQSTVHHYSANTLLDDIRHDAEHGWHRVVNTIHVNRL